MGLEDWFPPLGPYPLKYEVGIGVPFVTLRCHFRKVRYVEHIQWDSMRKGLKSWDNIYGSGVLGMGEIFYARDREKFTKTACPTKVPRFGKFMRGYKLRMGVINKQDFGVTSEIIKDSLE